MSTESRAENQRAFRPDFAEVTAELDRRRFISLGFERIEALLGALGDPQEALKVVQVVGTNGKGTTAVALSAALEEEGESTGTYLSPHVVSYAERIRIRGEQVSREGFAHAVGEALRLADERGIGVTQFELLTAGALWTFREAGVRWTILEAGLGARYDATTAAGPEAVVLTNVSLDHTEYLGETVEEIAREKLASVPNGGVLVLGSDDPLVARLARESCERAGADLAEILPSEEEAPPLRGLPPYAAADVYLGFRAAEVLLGRKLGGEVLRRVAERVKGALVGRFEVHDLDGTPLIIDGGHNPEGVRAALAAVKKTYPGRPVGVVFGVLRDKDIRSMLATLGAQAETLVLTRPEGERAADPAQVGREYAPTDAGGRPAAVKPGMGDALRAVAKEIEGQEGVILVTGSLSTSAACLGWLEDERERNEGHES